jgi:hypothetical protein
LKSIFGQWHWVDGVLKTGTGLSLFNPSIVNFFSFFCSAEGLYEGTPLYPALFSNARDRISF